MSRLFELSNLQETKTFAEKIAYNIDQNGGGRLYLEGDLGAGKTTLTRFLFQALGVKGRIKSPTFSLLEQYDTPTLKLYHFDFYRFNDPQEWHEAGFDEILLSSALSVVEWPNQAGPNLPMADLHIYLSALSATETSDGQELNSEDDKRQLTLTPNSTIGCAWINSL